MTNRGAERNDGKAVVLLSGGLDSATVLALAGSRGYQCHTISFDYGQRHDAELAAAERIAEAMQVVEHKLLRLDLGSIGGSALTDTSIPVPERESAGIPITYVPARNTIFLSLALGWAEVLGAGSIWIGVNAVDYSGYPDCRPEYVRAFQAMANLATRAAVDGTRLDIVTPLENMDKAEIIRTGTRLGVDYGLTVSCYQASADGLACGVCDSCRLRRRGFVRAAVADPTRYRADG